MGLAFPANIPPSRRPASVAQATSRSCTAISFWSFTISCFCRLRTRAQCSVDFSANASSSSSTSSASSGWAARFPWNSGPLHAGCVSPESCRYGRGGRIRCIYPSADSSHKAHRPANNGSSEYANRNSRLECYGSGFSLGCI